jgi:hypothetical protein
MNYFEHHLVCNSIFDFYRKDFPNILDTFRWADIIPIWPKNTSDYEPTVDRWLFFMLHTISDTCKRVLWDSNRESLRIDKQEECFRFLFDMFKRYYLPTLFPTFTEQNIYDLSVSSKNESCFCVYSIFLNIKSFF